MNVPESGVQRAVFCDRRNAESLVRGIPYGRAEKRAIIIKSAPLKIEVPFTKEFPLRSSQETSPSFQIHWAPVTKVWRLCTSDSSSTDKQGEVIRWSAKKKAYNLLQRFAAAFTAVILYTGSVYTDFCLQHHISAYF